LGPNRGSAYATAEPGLTGCRLVPREAVKNQYFGDVNDFKKYGLLKHLSSSGDREIAVCWSLTHDDSRSDGSRIRYLADPQKWRSLDPELFDFIRNQVVDRGVRSVDVLSDASVIPNCRFFADMLPDDLTTRESYFARFFLFARGSDLTFFDPDNGLGITAIERGKRNSSKYVYPCEIEQAWRNGHSILFYQHFPRRPRDAFLQRLADSLSHLPGLRSVYFFVTSHVVFVLLPAPDSERLLAKAAVEFGRRWGTFVRVEARRLDTTRTFSPGVNPGRASPTPRTGDRTNLPSARCTA
jgi:hypothetical protein